MCFEMHYTKNKNTFCDLQWLTSPDKSILLQFYMVECLFYNKNSDEGSLVDFSKGVNFNIIINTFWRADDMPSTAQQSSFLIKKDGKIWQDMTRRCSKI